MTTSVLGRSPLGIWLREIITLYDLNHGLKHVNEKGAFYYLNPV
jgi:hypothetical protein